MWEPQQGHLAQHGLGQGSSLKRGVYAESESMSRASQVRIDGKVGQAGQWPVQGHRDEKRSGSG